MTSSSTKQKTFPFGLMAPPAFLVAFYVVLFTAFFAALERGA